MGLLSGLGGLGLGNLDGMSLYDAPKKEAKAENEPEQGKTPAPEIKESDFLFEKGYKCVVCDREFKVLAIRTGKAKLKGTEMNLRPRYENVEPLKYEVVMCPRCGCSAHARYWGNLTPTQRKNVIENISKAFKTKNYDGDTYTYEEAFERYQMALANTMVRQSKASEKAYICLKAGWLLQSKAENLDPTLADFDLQKKYTLEQADEYLKSAVEGLIQARRSEQFPICGMDESTVDYLIAALLVEQKEYDQAAKLVGSLLASKTANSRMKDKALTLKEIIQKGKAQN